MGGGDLINDYFTKDIVPVLKKFQGPKIAFSIGIPFPSLIKDEYLGYYDHIFTRNYEDLREIQKVVGAKKAHYIPDIALMYSPKILYKPPSEIIKPKICGMFLVGNLIEFPKITENIIHLVSKIASSYQVVLYCMDQKEDVKFAELVKKLANNKSEIHSITVDNNLYTANIS